MFWKKKPDPIPLGVPLGNLKTLLRPTSIKAQFQGDTLVAQHQHYAVHIEVVPPEDDASDDNEIRAVVRMVAELPKALHPLFVGKEAAACAAYNAFAGLGAVFVDSGRICVGSRLTIYEDDDAWDTLNLPLLFFTTICGTEAILGALRRTMRKEGPRGGASKWTERDFAKVHIHLSRTFQCTTGGLGLTAEFGLTQDAESAAAGDHNTALFQLIGDQSHPELGGGLFCLLQMPHQIKDEQRLHQVCMLLNRMEMAAQDLPPHFGAWCPGRMGNNPAYVSFLPNCLYSVSGIAVNVSMWAAHRAQWANAVLEALGISS